MPCTAGCCVKTEGVELTDNPTLFMEFHAAHESSLELGLTMVREICEEFGALNVRTTTRCR